MFRQRRGGRESGISAATQAHHHRQGVRTAELLVIGYPDVDTANKSLATVEQLEKDLIMQTGGAAVVKKTEDGKVEMVTKTGATSSGAAMGGFWGMLFGLILLLVPVGSLMGALMGTISGWGVKDEFR